MVASHNRFLIPNTDDFFNSLLLLLRESADVGLSGHTAEFYSLRLEEYQRTLAVMYSRLSEYRRNSAEELVHDAGQLIKGVVVKF